MNKIQWNFIPSKKTFGHKNASEKKRLWYVGYFV